MITVKIFRNQKNIKSFVVSGHAMYAKNGKDILCSAVSMATQTAVLGLIKVAGVEVEYKIDEGFLSCSLPDLDNVETQLMAKAILETMYVGLLDIEESNKKHIQIIEEEV